MSISYIGKNNKTSFLIKLFVVSLIFMGVFLFKTPPVSAAARNEGRNCFKNTGYVNTVVSVMITDELGNFVRFSDSFSFRVQQVNTTGLYMPATAYGIGQDADGQVPDGGLWEGNNRVPAYSGTARDYRVDPSYNSSSICDAGAFGGILTAQVFGDRFTDGHPYLACHYGSYGTGILHGLGFRFDVTGIYDTGGRAGHWVTTNVNKFPRFPTDDINNSSENVIFVWQYDRAGTGSDTRFVIDATNCNGISGWAYNFTKALNREPVQVHIYVDGVPGSNPYGGWPLLANQASPDLTAASTGLGGFWIPGNYRWRVDPQATPLPGLDLTIPHVLNFYLPNVQGGFLAGVGILLPDNCPRDSGFNITPSGTTQLNDDAESPGSAIFTGTFNSDKNVNGIGIRCEYYIDRLAPGPNIDIGNDNKTLDLRTSGSCGATIDISSRGLVAGDKVCQNIVVTPGSGRVLSSGARVAGTDGTAKTVAPPLCDTVVDKPYVSFYGNDVYAGSSFQDVSGACATPPAGAGKIVGWSKLISGNYAGSGTQLAATALDAIDNFSSSSVRSPSIPNRLSFANTSGTFGGSFGNGAKCLKNYFAGFVGPGTSGDISDLSSYSSTIYRAGNTILDGTGTDNLVGVGQKLTIYVNGNLTIKDNIIFSSYTNISQIPGLYIVVSGNISIANNVSRLEGVYIAQPNATPNTGQINTCTDTSGTPFIDTNQFINCKNQLTIYGSFISKKTNLQRTFQSLRNANPGESSSSSSAAEKFIFSPEAYLVTPAGLPNLTLDDYKLQYQTSLPPVL